METRFDLRSSFVKHSSRMNTIGAAPSTSRRFTSICLAWSHVSSTSLSEGRSELSGKVNAATSSGAAPPFGHSERSCETLIDSTGESPSMRRYESNLVIPVGASNGIGQRFFTMGGKKCGYGNVWANASILATTSDNGDDEAPPAAILCPPPPNSAAIIRTSTSSFFERNEMRTQPSGSSLIRNTKSALMERT